MTCSVLVLTSGQAARVHIEHRDAEGRFERTETREVAADSYFQVWVPDHGQIIVDEEKPTNG